MATNVLERELLRRTRLHYLLRGIRKMLLLRERGRKTPLSDLFKITIHWVRCMYTKVPTYMRRLPSMHSCIN